MVRSEGGDVHQRRDTVVPTRPGDEHPRVVVGDEHGAPCQGVEDVAEIGGIARGSAQRIGDRNDRDAVFIEARDHFIPAGRIGECPVNQDDSRRAHDVPFDPDVLTSTPWSDSGCRVLGTWSRSHR